MAFGSSSPKGFKLEEAPVPRSKRRRGLLLCLVGLPGTGKSSILAQWPDSQWIIDHWDQGILDLMQYSEDTDVHVKEEDVTVCETYEDYMSALEMAVDGPKATIVMESLVGIQALCDNYTMRYDYDFPNNKKAGNTFVNFRNGYELAATTHFQALLSLMLRAQSKDKNVLLCAHSKVGTAKGVIVDDWVSQVFNTAPEYCRRLDATFQAILHIGQGFIPAKFAAGKSKPPDSYTATIYTEFNPQFPAKNRMGVHGTIEVGASAVYTYRNICQTLKLDPKTGSPK